MGQVARFAISTESRHPAFQQGYSSDEHGYLSEYVQPREWRLKLGAFPDGAIEEPEGHLKPPDDVAFVLWSIRQVDGNFIQETRKERSSSRMLSLDVSLPQPGRFSVTLTLGLIDGSQVTSTRPYSIRDLLFVSVGDSFASGEGNPDVIAVPSDQDQVICRATTIADIIRTEGAELSRWENYIENRSKDTVEGLGQVGRVLVGIFNGVKALSDFATSAVRDLSGYLVDLSEEVVTESIEEIVSWFGIGDGGERPHAASWQEWNAHRSYRSGVSLAARKLEVDDECGAVRVTFLNFARTGSTVFDGILGPRTYTIGKTDFTTGRKISIDGWTVDRGQVEEVKQTIGSRRIDALLITTGINDIGFSGLVTNALLYKRKRSVGLEEKAAWLTNDFPNELGTLDQAIRKELNPRWIFVSEYPVRVFSEVAAGTDRACGILGSALGFSVTAAEATRMGVLGQQLNATIKTTGRRLGWIPVSGIETGFSGHGYCSSTPFFVGAEESCNRQGDFDGTLHPNRFGHAVTRDCITSTVAPVIRQEHWLEPVLSILMFG